MDRRSFVKALLACSAASTIGGIQRSSGAEFILDARKVPQTDRVLIKGGSLVTMNSALPDFVGDLLIEGGKIAAIDRTIEAGNAEVVDASRLIVAPGFVETHRHTWQSCLRHLGANWSAAQYFANNFFKFGVVMRPEDVYAANLFGIG